MADATKGTNFFIVPKVDRQSATQAEAQIEALVAKAARAVEQGNDRVLQTTSAKLAKKLGQAPPEVTVKVGYETNSATGQIKKIERLSAGALDPMIADYKKMVAIQGQSALAVKKEIALQKDKLNRLKQQATTLSRQGRAYKKNAQQQKLVVDQTKKLEQVLMRVSTLSSLKGQLRAESQKLSMMSQYNLELNKQGQLVPVINQEFAKQQKLVMGLGQGVKAAGSATMTFGQKIAGAGQAMQAAFGWIAAVVAGITAIAGAIGKVTGRVKDIQALKLTFDGLGQSVEAQNAILGSAKNIALSYGVSLRKIEGAYRRLGPAILESGGSLKDTEGAIKSIAARTTMLGLNTEQAGRYIEAFAQVMGKGKLQGEELNQQFSELDGGLRGQLKNWLKANKGITDFEGSMKKGEITSGLFLEAFEAINEEIRNKFLRSIGDTQKGIETMGEKGGMTLNQLNQKLQTLVSIGLESVAEALAPLGKELMKIYAAFVQVFTKIATEMPGIQAAFKFLGHVIGVVLKVALNSALLLFGNLMKALDAVFRMVGMLYNALKNIPGLGGMLEGLEQAAKGLNANFDGMVDSFSKLSDETIGATSNLAKYADEAEMLEDQLMRREISEEQYYKKMEELEARKLEAQKANLNERLNAELEAMNKMIAAKEKQLERERELAERKIEKIEEARDAEIGEIDKVIKKLEEQKEAAGKAYEKKKEAVKEASAIAIQALDKEIYKLNQIKSETTAMYDRAISAAKNYYSQQRSMMDANHSRAMAQLDAEISKRQREQQSQLSALSGGGPAQKNLDLMKRRELQRELRTTGDKMRKAEIKAEIESMDRAKQRAQLERQFAEENAEMQAEKEELEKKQAEEKKRLDEEEKARVRALEEEKRASLQQIAEAITFIAEQKKAEQEAEKAAVNSINKAKKKGEEDYNKAIKAQKEIRESVTKDALNQIEKIRKALDKEEKKVEDIKRETDKIAEAQRGVGIAADRVTGGALQRQLNKVNQIKTALQQAQSQANNLSVPNPPRAAGGPVSAGQTYQVNELGREGFLSPSGKMSEIQAPSYGSWKAPSSGTVIPAHIWKQIKAGQKSGPTSPRMVDPGNAVARSISTINNSTGGNTVSNNVTIQAQNPVQASNNVMVQLTKLKRLRYS